VFALQAPDARPAKEVEMKDKQPKSAPQKKRQPTFSSKERRKKERRKDACEGYAYIQMVGWMDRRERARRDNDCIQD
jgi:hypothetical protein